MAAIRRSAMAALAPRRAHHQAIMGADQIIVVKRHDDARLWQHATHERGKLRADQQQMMDVDDVRPELEQQFFQIGDDAVEIDLAHEEPVEMASPEQDLVDAVANTLEAGARLLVAVDTVGGTQEERLAAGPLIGAEQVMREDLGAAGMQVGVVVGDDQNAFGHAHPVFSTTKMSW